MKITVITWKDEKETLASLNRMINKNEKRFRKRRRIESWKTFKLWMRRVLKKR